ncbi:MAG: agmatine deiminase family protein, partial [bacterium]|nr:agmatine deiminase family protein [bacterium]
MTFRMPAEWAPHDWTWIGFPTNPAEWPGAFAEARAQIAAFASALHAGGRGEEVRLVVASEADAQAARALVDPGVTVLVQALGDVWLRDTAPIAVLNDAGDREHRRALVDFGFNGWGGKDQMPGDE